MSETNYCNCPNCQTVNCPAGIENAALQTWKDQAESNYTTGDALATKLRQVEAENAALREENAMLVCKFDGGVFIETRLRVQLREAGKQIIALREQLDIDQNEVIRLTGLLRVANTERNDANKMCTDIREQLRREKADRKNLVESLMNERKVLIDKLCKANEDAERAWTWVVRGSEGSAADWNKHRARIAKEKP